MAGFSTPAELVDEIQRRGRPERSRELLGALLRLAEDDVAARAFLQAVLPALAAKVRGWWARRWPGSTPWPTMSDLDDELVAEAFAQIRRLAGTSPRWPDVAVVEAAWRRIRSQLGRYRRHQAELVPLDPDVRAAAGRGSPSPADQLTAVVVEAVAAGRLDIGDAGLVFTTRVLGHRVADLPLAMVVDQRTLRWRRSRAERRLTAAVCAGSRAASWETMT